jgi:Ca2+-binding EF-hand superfamily protein
LRRAAAVCLAGVAVALAQTSNYVRAFPLLAALDTDRDGLISAAEIANAPAVLRGLDANHDGKLSFEECGLSGASVAAASAAGKEAGEIVKTYMAFDKNGDGKLQEDELPERMRGIFDRPGANKDRVLTPDGIRQIAEATIAEITAFRSRTRIG